MDTFTKIVDEAYTVSVDFADVLASGETISTAVATAICAGKGADTAAIIDSTTISGTTARVKVKDGMGGYYILDVKIITSAANTFIHQIKMEVD